MPVKKKKASPKKKAAPKPKKVFVCMPCGTEVVITKEGIGETTLMCCGEIMKSKGKK
jgi:transcription elongation factor Elf1